MLSFAVTALALAGALAQDPTSTPIETFRALPEDRQISILRSLDRRILLDPNSAIQAVVSLARAFDSYPVAERRTFHDPKKWTKGVAPKRTVVRAGTPAHQRLRSTLPAVPFLTDLHKAVWYDWSSGRVVRREQALSRDEVFENLLHGYPPGSDAAAAHVLAALDTDGDRRPMAAYLDHLYADLKARVYEDVTLYEAWYSGKVVDVPDVDAIPFAIQILKTRAFRSPIPKGRKRTRLYQQISEHTTDHRRYRTLREAAAGGFVRAEPKIDPTYLPLVPRFHFLWASEQEDPERVAAWLADLPDRAAFLAKIDQAWKADSEAFQRREARKLAVAEMADKVRGLALGELPAGR